MTDTSLQTLISASLLVSNPKFSACENGALLFKLVLSWSEKHNIRLQEAFGTRTKPWDSFNVGLVPSDHLCGYFLDLYSHLLKISEVRPIFLKLAKVCPMHGLLTTIRLCLDTEMRSLSPNLVEALIETLEKSVSVMLSKISVDLGANSSFADMSEAIDAIIDHDPDQDHVEISEEHQLVLACAWLNLKESALLCASLVSDCLELMSPDLVVKAGGILVTILTMCRHKGALEATSLAMKDFATSLLAQDDPTFVRVPEDMLKSILNQVR